MIVVWVQIGFAILAVAGFILEMIGVHSKRKGDTASEGWQWINDHLPPVPRWFWRIFWIGFPVWLALHWWSGGKI